MLGMLKYSDGFSKSFGLLQCWLKDEGAGAFGDNTGLLQRRNYLLRNNGNFSFCVPLSHIFGFCEDYNMELYGVKHELILTRQGSKDALFRSNTLADGVINLSELTWFFLM